MADFLGEMLVLIKADDSDTSKKIKLLESNLKKFGESAKKIGANLTKFVTLPIVGAGTAALKFAIDAEETGSKFFTAFKGIEETATNVSKKLQEEYGLSTLESQKLLSSTGDLLKGFGASADTALILSESVQQAAVDLASYNNVQGGAARASEIITKAMLGERDALTSLGIKISEADVKTALLAKGQENLTGRALLLAKAQATLGLVYDQSGDALGDFNRTQSSAANQLKQLKSDVIDLASSFGRELLPLFTDLIGKVREGIKWFSELDSGQKKTVITILAVVAAIGPLLSLIGALTTALPALATAFAVLSGPVGIAVGSLVAVGAAIAVITDNARKLEQAELKEQFGELAETAKLTHAEFQIIIGYLDTINEQKLFEESAKTTLNLIKDLSKEIGVSEDIILQIGLKSDDVNDKIKQELKLIQANIPLRKKQLAQLADIQEFNGQHITSREILAVKQKELNVLKEEELSREAAIAKIEAERIAKLRVDRLAAQAKLKDEIRVTNILRNAGIIDAIEANERLQTANRKLIDQLAKLNFNSFRGESGDRAIIKARAEIERLGKENENLTRNIASAASEQISLSDNYVKTITANYLAYSDNLLTSAEVTTEAINFLQQQALEEQLAVEEAAFKTFQDNFDKRVEVVNDFKNKLFDIFSEISNNEKLELQNREYAATNSLDRIISNKNASREAEYTAEKAAVENSLKTEEEKKELLAEIEKKYKEREKEDDEKSKKESLKLEEKFAKEKRKIKRDEAIAQKLDALFSIAVSTAREAVKVAAIPVLSAAVVAFGTLQAAIVSARPLPALAEGGLAKGPSIIGDAGDELAVPLEGTQGRKAINIFAQELIDVIGKTGNVTNNNKNVTANITNNNLFGPPNEETYRDLARDLFPYIVGEGKRRGIQVWQ